jgi:hypothetical protein
MVATRELERSVALDEPLKVGQRRAGQLDIDLRRWTLFGGGVRLPSNIKQRVPKPKVGGSTPLGTVMNQNDNFKFVALAKLDLFAKSASGATWGYTRRRSFIFSAPLLITKSRKIFDEIQCVTRSPFRGSAGRRHV